MNKTKIEWCDYTINPVKGLCPMACTYCYARRMYLNPFYKPMYEHQEIRFDVKGYQDDDDWGISKLKNPSRIFVGSTMELFGDWIEPRWLEVLFQMIRRYPQHTFIFLTKQPQNLIKWSPFPSNCWVGYSVTDWRSFHRAAEHLFHIQAGKLFVSIEPLLDRVEYIKGGMSTILPVFQAGWLDWIIIGQQTPVSVKTSPKVEWIREIVEAADKVKIPVFLKNNLKPLYGNPNPYVPNILDTWWGECNVFGVKLRQELPL